MQITSHNAFQRFSQYIRVAIDQAGRHDGASQPLITLGNVDFWIEGGDMIYSRPISAWDTDQITLQLTRILSQIDDYKRFAVLAGYQVLPLPGECGEADTYYWKRRGAPADQDESDGTFETEALAWADCCLFNKFDFDYKGICEPLGFTVEPSIGGNYYWQNADHAEASEDFRTQAEAWRDCYIVMTDQARNATQEAEEMACPGP